MHADPTGARLELVVDDQRIGIDGVVFDCDGLLVDSESIWIDIVRDALRAHGLPHGETQLDAFYGLTIDDSAALLAAAGLDPETAGAELRARYEERIAAGVEAMPGAVALVRALADRGVPIAVASNGDGAHVRALLGAAGIVDLFDALVTANDVAHGKPHPEPFARAAALLGTAPERTLAADDTAVGGASARAAGLWLAGVNADASVELPAQLRLATLDELALRLGLVPTAAPVARQSHQVTRRQSRSSGPCA